MNLIGLLLYKNRSKEPNWRAFIQKPKKYTYNVNEIRFYGKR